MSTHPAPAGAAALDYASLRGDIQRLRLPELKALCKATGLSAKGRKSDIADRVFQLVDPLVAAGHTADLMALRLVLLKIDHNDPVPPFHSLVASLRSNPAMFDRMRASLDRFAPIADATARPRAAGAPPPPDAYAGPILLFKSTLFYTLRLAVGGVHVLKASKGRSTADFCVSLQSHEASLLRSAPRMKLFLFCGAESAPDKTDAPVVFPPVEIHVNNTLTKQHVRGIKGKPGTARPADLTPYLRPLDKPAHVRIVYSDAPERYLLYAYIVEEYSPDELVHAIAQKPHIPSASTRQAISLDHQMGDDDDIVVGTFSLSLRCPLTYTRIAHPMKSVTCDHIQCFDGLSFLIMQSRIPAWQCPVCSNYFSQYSLAVCDYTREILDSTPPEVDKVTLKHDGAWEIELDDDAPSDTSSSPPEYTEPKQASVDQSIEIISLDSDEDEPAPPQPPPVPRIVPPTAPDQPRQNAPDTPQTAPAPAREAPLSGSGPAAVQPSVPPSNPAQEVFLVESQSSSQAPTQIPDVAGVRSSPQHAPNPISDIIRSPVQPRPAESVPQKETASEAPTAAPTFRDIDFEDTVLSAIPRRRESASASSSAPVAHLESLRPPLERPVTRHNPVIEPLPEEQSASEQPAPNDTAVPALAASQAHQTHTLGQPGLLRAGSDPLAGKAGALQNAGEGRPAVVGAAQAASHRRVSEPAQKQTSLPHHINVYRVQSPVGTTIHVPVSQTKHTSLTPIVGDLEKATGKNVSLISTILDQVSRSVSPTVAERDARNHAALAPFTAHPAAGSAVPADQRKAPATQAPQINPKSGGQREPIIEQVSTAGHTLPPGDPAPGHRARRPSIRKRIDARMEIAFGSPRPSPTGVSKEAGPARTTVPSPAVSSIQHGDRRLNAQTSPSNMSASHLYHQPPNAPAPNATSDFGHPSEHIPKTWRHAPGPYIPAHSHIRSHHENSMVNREQSQNRTASAYGQDNGHIAANTSQPPRDFQSIHSPAAHAHIMGPGAYQNPRPALARPNTLTPMASELRPLSPTMAGHADLGWAGGRAGAENAGQLPALLRHTTPNGRSFSETYIGHAHSQRPSTKTYQEALSESSRQINEYVRMQNAANANPRVAAPKISLPNLAKNTSFEAARAGRISHVPDRISPAAAAESRPASAPATHLDPAATRPAVPQAAAPDQAKSTGVLSGPGPSHPDQQNNRPPPHMPVNSHQSHSPAESSKESDIVRPVAKPAAQTANAEMQTRSEPSSNMAEHRVENPVSSNSVAGKGTGAISTAAPRFSRSAFDELNEPGENRRVKGILGLEFPEEVFQSRPATSWAWAGNQEPSAEKSGSSEQSGQKERNKETFDSEAAVQGGPIEQNDSSAQNAPKAQTKPDFREHENQQTEVLNHKFDENQRSIVDHGNNQTPHHDSYAGVSNQSNPMGRQSQQNDKSAHPSHQAQQPPTPQNPQSHQNLPTDRDDGGGPNASHQSSANDRNKRGLESSTLQPEAESDTHSVTLNLLDHELHDMALHTPQKRPNPSDTEPSGNKRVSVSKSKFDPSTVNQADIIELD